MATKTKRSDVGWMYHAPAKPRTHMPAASAPAPSQIPGLNCVPMSEYPEEPQKKLLIHEHDSPYIRMAKQGGRPDLLRQRTPPPRKENAKAYPRVDWFYQEDIKMEQGNEEKEEEPQGPYEFYLPEYMVHEEYKPQGDGEGGSHHMRNILSRDASNVFQREGNGAADKTVKIEESRAHGYGVRQARKNHRGVTEAAAQYSKGLKQHNGHTNGDAGHANFARRTSAEEDRPAMSKLLAYGYQRDYDEQKQKWEQQNNRTVTDGATNTEKMQSEYQARMQMDGERKPRVPSHGRRAPNSAQRNSGNRRQKPKEEESKPDFFNSLSKYSVDSKRIESRRLKTQLIPAVAAPRI